jgi:gentisate 1,2-dioxygenase
MSTRKDAAVNLVDQTGATAPPLDLWPSIVVRKATLDAEIDRLAGLPAPADGRRRSLVAHPRAEPPGLGLAPGITVSLEVLLPGEETAPIRHNSSFVSLCIAGGGETVVDGGTFSFGTYDVLCVPSMATYVHRNPTGEVQVRLAYSNAALLEKLNVHLVDEDPDPEGWVFDEHALRAAGDRPGSGGDDGDAQPSPVPDLMPMGESGAMLMSYERLINPPLIDSKPLHWPWPAVRAELDRLMALGADYRGRRLFLLYNPVTGRTNGTTLSFFATMTVRPPGIVDRPHRHVAAAINYFFSGSGYSRVGGQRYEWSAGDLMLSAPGWEVHHHASNDEPVYELTIQDSPAHLATDSLLWQEDLKRPPRLLGSHPGFETNRSTLQRGPR